MNREMLLQANLNKKLKENEDLKKKVAKLEKEIDIIKKHIEGAGMSTASHDVDHYKVGGTD